MRVSRRLWGRDVLRAFDSRVSVGSLGLMVRLTSSQRTPLVCTSSALSDCKRFSSEKSVRLFLLELNKVRTEFRLNPTRAQREASIRTLTSVPLHQLRGIDSKTVAQCLTTLVTLDAPSDLPLVHECALWTSVHPGEFTSHSLAQSLYSLVRLEYHDTIGVLYAVKEQLLAVVKDMAPSSLCMMFASVLMAYAAPSGVHLSATSLGGGETGKEKDIAGTQQGLADVSQQLSVNVLRVVNEGLGLTEKAMIAIALGGFVSKSAVATGLERFVAEHVIAQLSAATWGSFGGAELSILSVVDVVGLLLVMHTAPPSIHDAVASSILEELRKRVDTQPLVSSRYAIHMARATSCLAKVDVDKVYYHTSQEVLKKIIAALEAYVATDAITLDSAAQLLGEFSSADGSAAAAPQALKRFIVRAINTSREKWDVKAVHTVLRVFSKDDELRADAQVLATCCVELVKAKCVAGAPVDAGDIAALLVENIVDPHAETLASAVASNIGNWSVSQVMTFLHAAANVNGKPTRAIMRDVASKLAPCMEKATASQVAAVMSSYGRARVRNDALCQSITNRAALLGAEMSLQHISTILGGLAAVEYKDTKLFLDLAPVVIAQASSADAAQTVNLLAAYAKMLVWNFRLIWSLAERSTVIYEQFTLAQILAVVTSLNRMDVQHDVLMQALLQQAMRFVSEKAQPSLPDIVMILSAFSRSGVWDTAFFEDLGRILIEQKDKLTADELGETLMSFARVGFTQRDMVDSFTLRALAMAPTCSLQALANIAIAFSISGCRHEELFSIIADRFINQKMDIPAVTIASVLSAFASIGIRNDRLFIEAIPRVRHVGQYGTPKDITNVVYAYSQVGLWHYKLFVRLADRAIQLRGEFRCDHVAKLLEAYARVNMRYEKLFVEFSSRIQTLAHLMNAGEITSIVHSYVTVRMVDRAVVKACVERSLEILDSFEEDEAVRLCASLQKAELEDESLTARLTKKFPNLAVSLQQKDGNNDIEKDPESFTETVEDESSFVETPAEGNGRVIQN
uniref:Uncharacterized protein TCIL3000_10_8390 n=1 Tax=Trypanosoma congolense (strain IL3000) TaxID=1068625 RepID=G0UXE6_TRYCI|nr:unnamed protein product [Trypanosoma congolense IL3000]